MISADTHAHASQAGTFDIPGENAILPIVEIKGDQSLSCGVNRSSATHMLQRIAGRANYSCNGRTTHVDRRQTH